LRSKKAISAPANWTRGFVSDDKSLPLSRLSVRMMNPHSLRPRRAQRDAFLCDASLSASRACRSSRGTVVCCGKVALLAFDPMCAPAQEVIGGGQILGCDAQIGGATRGSTVLIKLGFSTCGHWHGF
jgi:hypothetical protein